MTELVFRTSMYGRFGHLVMSTAGMVFVVASGVLFLGRGDLSSVPSIVLAGSALLGLCGLGLAIYSACFALGPAARFRLTEEGLRYRGAFGSRHIPWEDFETARLDYAGRSPFVFLLVRRRGARSFLRMNASGLAPAYGVLFDWIGRKAPQSVRLRR